MVWLQCEGVGKDSIPGAIDFDVVDDMMQVTDKQSFTVRSCPYCAAHLAYVFRCNQNSMQDLVGRLSVVSQPAL